MLRLLRSALPPLLVLHLRRRLASDLYPPQPVATRPPLDAGYLEHAHQCLKLLRDNLVAFYLPASIDAARGGYFETLSGGGFRPDASKNLA